MTAFSESHCLARPPTGAHPDLAGLARWRASLSAVSLIAPTVNRAVVPTPFLRDCVVSRGFVAKLANRLPTEPRIFVSVAPDMIAALSQLRFVTGLGNSCSQPTFDQRPS